MIRAVNVHVSSPIAWFTRDQLDDWMAAHDVKIVDGAPDFLDDIAIAVLIPNEVRSLALVVPELGEEAEMPRHHLTQYLAARGLNQPYKAACELPGGKRFQLMVYGPEEAWESPPAGKAKRKPRPYTWPPPPLVPDGHALHGRAFVGDSPREISETLKQSHPDSIVFVQNGYFLEAFDADAYACAELFGWHVADHGTHGKFTGVPIRARRFKDKLQESGKAYIVVLQQDYPAPDGPIVRQVHDVFGT